MAGEHADAISYVDDVIGMDHATSVCHVVQSFKRARAERAFAAGQTRNLNLHLRSEALKYHPTSDPHWHLKGSKSPHTRSDGMKEPGIFAADLCKTYMGVFLPAARRKLKLAWHLLLENH
ncbi:hypothetical protein V8E55_003359 [Tylopilus felleus]